MKNNISLDDYSVKILQELQEDGRLTVQEISSKIGLSMTPTWKRMKSMEQNGVICRYTTVLDRSKIGLANCVLAEVNLSKHGENFVEDFEAAVRQCPTIIECYSTTGSADYVLKVVTTNITSYDTFLHDVIFKLPGVSGIRSSVVLREVKCNAPMPLDHLEGA
ncbi:Leucine-responsive regulatory protein [compost metagenome]